MSAVVTVLHVLVCIFLIAVVLLQRGKGAQIGAVFGGGAGSTLFGSRGAGNFLTKLTAIAATVYMLTSLSLSYFGITGAGERLFEDGAATEAPVENSLFEEVGTAPADPGAVEQPAAEAVQPEAGADAPAASPPDADSKSDAAPTPDAG
jgi:preprotein translocase subunit SecG